MHQTHTYNRTLNATPRRVLVSEFEHVVLVRRGCIERVLQPGVHRLRPRIDRLVRFPRAEQILVVKGQETLTGDGAGVRATVALTYRIADAIEATRASPFVERLHLKVQLALRNVLGERELEQLLADRSTLDSALVNQVRHSVGDEIGVIVIDVAVRDLIVPGALRAAVAEVVSARLAGQAALERARGETAALRSLANAARLAQDNPALLQLRLLQTVEPQGNTFVLGAGAFGLSSS